MTSKPVIFEKPNVLVTGGAGFIGSHLCEELLKTSRVLCVDNFITSQESNIDHLLRHEDFEFIRHDLNTVFDPDAYPELTRFRMKFQGIQEIYHLACPTSPKKFEAVKIQTLLANSVGMKYVLDLAQQFQAKILFASSCVVYGARPADGHAFREEEIGGGDTLSPRACYDEGKRFAETMCATYAQVHQLDVRVARVFRTYGPRMPLYDGQMIPDFITSALDGHAIDLFGDETFCTSLVYVSDVVDGLLKIMKAPPGLGPVNVGSDTDVKLVDVAQRIIEMTGSASKIQFKESLLFMTQLGLPDLAKAKERLGWLPIVSLDRGLQQTIDYTMAHKSLLGLKL